MSIDTKINDIVNILKDIEKEDEFVASVLFEGLGLSMKIIEQAVKNNGRSTIDVSEHLEMITRLLGVSLKDLVAQTLQTQETQKEPDEETLKFITADLDDYEKFLAQAKAKESIEFLASVI